MSCILHIETSTEACSVAVSEDGWNEFKVSDVNGPQHAVQLGVFIDEALSFVDSHAMVLDAVAVSCGPGSYTGLRIGVSMAKGICYGRNLPLIAIPTLEVLCVPVLLRDDLPEDTLLCPMIDARRMEVYAAIYDRALNVKREIAADIIDENSYLEFLEKHPVYFFGAAPSEDARLPGPQGPGMTLSPHLPTAEGDCTPFLVLSLSFPSLLLFICSVLSDFFATPWTAACQTSLP